MKNTATPARFKKIDGDDCKRIVELINLIERAYRDLKGVNMEKEINNTVMSFR